MKKAANQNKNIQFDFFQKENKRTPVKILKLYSQWNQMFSIDFI